MTHLYQWKVNLYILLECSMIDQNNSIINIKVMIKVVTDT